MIIKRKLLDLYVVKINAYNCKHLGINETSSTFCEGFIWVQRILFRNVAKENTSKIGTDSNIYQGLQGFVLPLFYNSLSSKTRNYQENCL